MNEFKKLQEDIQALLAGESHTAILAEEVQTIAESFDLTAEEINNFTVGELLESPDELFEGLGTSVLGGTAIAIALKKLRKEVDAKNLGCSKLKGEAKKTCVFKGHLDALKKKKAIYAKAKNACTTNSCKRSADKAMKNVDKQIAELLKKSR